MNRISEKYLQAVCDRINRAMNTPMQPYVDEHGKWTAQIGNYHISCAYGGKSLHQMVSDGGGVRDVFGCGHVTKRDLANRMHAYLRAIEDKQAA